MLTEEQINEIDDAHNWQTTAGRLAAYRAIEQAVRKEMEGDSERLDWIGQKLFMSRWNGVIDSGSRVNWMLAGDYRHTMHHMQGPTLRAAIDAARGQT